MAPLPAARGRRLRRAGTWVGVAAAAALVVSLGVWNAALQQDRDAQDAWGDRLASAVRDLGQPGTETVPLTGSDGSVVAVALVHDQDMSLVVDGLAPNDDGTTYVLWAKSRYGDVRPVGAFDVRARHVDVLPACTSRTVSPTSPRSWSPARTATPHRRCLARRCSPAARPEPGR